MQKINPTKPGKTQQNEQKPECGQLPLSLFEKLV